MPTVAFTENLRRHVACPAESVGGSTVREALHEVFAKHPQLRGYVVDEQGELRKHMSIFVNGQLLQDRQKLSDAVSPHDEIFIMQALSGG